MHPVIRERIREMVKKSASPVVVIDAPLLIESGLHREVDVVVVVKASDGDQLKRAMNRGYSEEDARNIIKNQLPLSEKLKSADYVIDNDNSVNKITEGVDRIWQRF